MSKFKTLKEILSTHPKIYSLTCIEEDDENFGNLKFVYENDIMLLEVSILFLEDEIYETIIK